MAIICLVLGVLVASATASDQHFRPGQATETHTCNHVRAVPHDLLSADVMRPDGLDATFYKKYTEAYGIPILGSAAVSDDALKRACYTARFLFAGHSGVRALFYKAGGRFAIMSEHEVTLDIPEHSHLDPYMNQRARGLGGTWGRPLTTGAEENLLCLSSDGYHSEDIFLHESAHAVDLVSAWAVIPNFKHDKDAAYVKANHTTGQWKNTYAMTNANEYWAEGVQSYFNVNTIGPHGGNGIHNDIGTRDTLRTYDPTLFNLIKEVFPCDNTYLKRCESTRAKENAQVLQMNCNTANANGANSAVLALLNNHDPHCEDTKPVDCLQRKLKGDCHGWPATANFMHTNCKASCGLCTPACVDKNTNCADWALHGECARNPLYMLPSCQISCKECRAHSGSPIG